MPITPTGFNVPLLSPAGLLPQRERRNGGFQSAIQEAMRQHGQQILQQRQFDFQRELEGQREFARQGDVFTGLLGRGDIVPVEQLPTLLGEDVPDLPTIAGEGRFSGREFVSGADVDRARREQLAAQPAGEGFVPGTTRGDITSFGPGGLEQSKGAAVVAQFQESPVTKESLLGMVDAITEQAGALPTVAAAAEALRESIEADTGGLTVAEFQTFANAGLNLQAMDTYDDSVRAINAMREDQRAAFQGMRATLSTRYGIEQEGLPGQLRNLTPAEKAAAAKALTGQTDSMTPAESALWEDMVRNNSFRERPNIINLAGDLQSIANSAGSLNHENNLGFVSWIEGNMNPQLSEMIIEHAGTDNAIGIQKWAANASSLRFRHAWALDEYGRSSRSSIERLIEGHVALPFELEGPRGVYSAFEVIYGDAFNDEPPSGRRRITNRFSHVTGQEEEARDNQVQSRFEDERTLVEDTFRRLTPEAMGQVELGLRTGSLEDIRASLRESANNLRRQSVIGNRPTEEINDARIVADYWDAVADFDQSTLRAWTDSVALPIFDRARRR